MNFNSEVERRNLETKAYLEAENLRFKGATAQEALNYFASADEGSRLKDWARATFKEEVRDAQEYYDSASAILHVTEMFDLYERSPESFRDVSEGEEYERKWKNDFLYQRHMSEFSGLGKAEEYHARNRKEAERQEKISQKNPLNHLIEARNSYEELIRIAEDEYGLEPNSWKGVEVETDRPQDEEGRLIENTADELLEPEDVETPEKFSTKLI